MVAHPCILGGLAACGRATSFRAPPTKSLGISPSFVGSFCRKVCYNKFKVSPPRVSRVPSQIYVTPPPWLHSAPESIGWPRQVYAQRPTTLSWTYTLPLVFHPVGVSTILSEPLLRLYLGACVAPSTSLPRMSACPFRAEAPPT